MRIEGRYFYPSQARFVPAWASAPEKKVIRIEDDHGDILAEGPAKLMKISSRLARLTRRFDLPDGAHFETDDNDGADVLLRRLRRWRRGRLTDRLEKAWPVIGLSVVVMAAALVFFVAQGVPVASEWLARKTLPVVAHTMSEQTLMALDRFALTPAKLSTAEQAHANALFQRVAAHAPGGVSFYRLIFRGGGRIGPNAFSLPDGSVVLTDPLWKLAKTDAEIEGVFAHEMSHAARAHQLQRVYAASLFPAALAIFTGDISQISQMAAILPGLIAQASYSRGYEQQADDDAAAIMRSMHEKPSAMAELMERLDKKMCGPKGCPPSWIGNHPDTIYRAARLRLEDRGPLTPADACAGDWTNRISLHCIQLYIKK